MPDHSVKPNPAVEVPIVHEDPDLIVVNKPAGTVTQPGMGHASDSLLNGMFALHDRLIGKLLHNLGSPLTASGDQPSWKLRLYGKI